MCDRKIKFAPFERLGMNGRFRRCKHCYAGKILMSICIINDREKDLPPLYGCVASLPTQRRCPDCFGSGFSVNYWDGPRHW